MWVTNLSLSDPTADALLGLSDSSFKGLRLNGSRAIRAKYPNGNPELSGQYYETTDTRTGVGAYTQGWVTDNTQWLAPEAKPKATNLIASGVDWPHVYWPAMNPLLPDQPTGGGDEGEFFLGMGGSCDDVFPPVGYWCSSNPPRGSKYVHRSPKGFQYETVLPQAERYAKPQGAVVQAWRGLGRWFSNQCVVDRLDPASKTLLFVKGATNGGCNQGGEGADSFSEWWIENVLEELDDAGEWYFDKDTRLLYYGFPHGQGPSGEEDWVATKTEVLFNLTHNPNNPDLS